MLTDRINAFNNQRTSNSVAAILCIVLGWLLLNQGLAVYRALNYEPIIQNENRITPTQRVEDYDVNPIVERNFFGRQIVNQELLQQTNLPTTNLQVVLRGVFTSTNPRQASAIIERPDGQVRSYRVNATVFGSSRLHAVFNDRIVLSTNGELETLYFPEPEAAQQSTTTEVAQVIEQVPQGIRELVENNMSAEEIREASQALSNDSLTAEQRAALIRERLLILRNRARENN